MQIAVAYGSALVVFGLVDAVWLSLMGSRLYRPTLGDILLPNLRLAPAVVFYLLFPLGIVVFAVIPALKSGAMATAFALGLLFGAIAYSTYDLTNYATLRNWTLQLTIADVAYGAVATALAAVAAAMVARTIAG
jgi:uncharacterized membrane protein